MKLTHALFYIFAALVLGFSVPMLWIVQSRHAPIVVVCESGSEVEATDKDDPFLVWTATCNLHDANGPAVTVEMID